MTSDHAPARLHMIGNAHIDPMWIWDWGEGMHEVLQTFRAAIERLGEDPDLVFTASSASYYDWVERTSPELFAQIKELVAGGRWVVTGGQWVEPDCNLPAGESVCRQFLYGQRYLAERMGVTATVGYNVDSFGHAGTLPQLLARSGITSYVMMRPAEHEKHIAAPCYWWEGADGTTLLAYRIPFEYSSSGAEDELLRQRSRDLLAQAGGLGHPLMGFFGVGDHGGGPTRLAMRTIHEISSETGGAVGFSSPARYFDVMSRQVADGAELPRVVGELQWHAVGCYSVRAALKRANARAEDMLVTAEAMAEMCRMLTGRDLRVGSELAEAWKGTLFAQFHDALGGTCSDPANRAVEQALEAAQSRAERVSTLAAHSMAEHVDTWTAGAETAEGIESAITGMPVPMIVFNPLSWPVTGTVSIPHPVTVAVSPSRERHAVQQVPSGEVTYSPTRALMQVRVPPFGFRRFWLLLTDDDPEATKEDAPPAAATSDEGACTLRNGHVQVTVNRATGALASMLADAVGESPGTEAIGAGGVIPVVIDDSSDTWSHGTARYDGDERTGELTGVELMEHGPVRATVRSTWSFGRSTVVQDVSVYQGQPYAEVRLDIDWYEHGRVLKLVVPTTLTECQSAAGAPYGFVERECTGHEEPMVHWVDLSDGTRGVACTADSAGGYDAQGGRLRLTVLRSPRVADHGWGWGNADPSGYPFTDQGRHRVRYRLTPHAGTWSDARITKMSDEQRVELPVVLDTWHAGELGSEAGALEVEGDSVVVPVVKRAENGAGTVLRVRETSGRPAAVKLSLSTRGRTWDGELGPQEVRTLFFPDDPRAGVRDVDIPELDLDDGAGRGMMGLA